MKLKLLGALIASFLIVGCGTSSDTTAAAAADATLERDITNSIGTANAEISGFGGSIEVDMVLKLNDAIDQNSFIITHAIDGVKVDLYIPAVLNNGSLMFVQDSIVIRENDSDATVVHTIEVVYYINDARTVYVYEVSQETAEEAADEVGTSAACPFAVSVGEDES